VSKLKEGGFVGKSDNKRGGREGGREEDARWSAGN